MTRKAARSAGESTRLRIIGGVHRSRVVRFPSRPGLRPTPDRVRETLFNWLGQELTGLHCLDLFAGSGALGLEAASRGASEVVFVEADPIAARPSDGAESDPLRAKKQKQQAKKAKPIQDEWGFFDPEQCGFSTLLAKLEEITEEDVRS